MRVVITQLWNFPIFFIIHFRQMRNKYYKKICRFANIFFCFFFVFIFLFYFFNIFRRQNLNNYVLLKNKLFF